MGDSYWRYAAAEGRQQQQQPLPPLIGKRSRSDYDVPGGHDLAGYFAREDERGVHRVVRDTDTLAASYDRYLRGAQLTPYGGGESARAMGVGLGGRPHEDPRMLGIGIGAVDPAVGGKGRAAGLVGGRPEISLPPDASNTLFVEGLPANCSRREVAHIFRPFVGYKEVRLVTKESRHASGEPLVLCFVDFESPAEAATAKDALQGIVFHEFPNHLPSSQEVLDKVMVPLKDIPMNIMNQKRSYKISKEYGYKFDEHDRDTVSLRLQFARYPGARSGGGHRGRR